jgi:hypothetical protein
MYRAVDLSSRSQNGYTVENLGLSKNLFLQAYGIYIHKVKIVESSHTVSRARNDYREHTVEGFLC